MRKAYAIIATNEGKKETMYEPMEAAIRHAKFLASHLSNCSRFYMIRLALKEIGVPSSKDGFEFAQNSILMLMKNPFDTLKNGIYPAVGLLRNPPAGQDQVEQSIRFGIRFAWKRRDLELWECYFPKGFPGSKTCPGNREFLMAIIDFVELWKECCEEVCCETTP